MTSKMQTSRRKGFTSMELAMTLPILMLMLFGVFEYSMLFFARGSVVEASRLGARAATYPGITPEYVEQTVHAALGPKMAKYSKIHTQIGPYAGDPCVVTVKVPMAAAAPDLLWPVGFGLRGQYLVSESVMQRE